jgi:hypothetical protein
VRKVAISDVAGLKKQYACKHMCLDLFSFSDMLISILDPQNFE